MLFRSAEVEVNVVDDYQFVFQADGNFVNAIVKTSTFDTIQDISVIEDALIKQYSSYFMSPSVDVPLHREGASDGLFDLYLNKFINNNELFTKNNPDLYETLYVFDSIKYMVDQRESLQTYQKTLFGALESRTNPFIGVAPLAVNPYREQISARYGYSEPVYNAYGTNYRAAYYPDELTLTASQVALWATDFKTAPTDPIELIIFNYIDDAAYEITESDITTISEINVFEDKNYYIVPCVLYILNEYKQTKI